MAKTPKKITKNTQAAPVTDAWAELKQLSSAAAGMLAAASKVSELFKSPEALKKVQDRQKLNALGRVLLNDLTNFNTRLSAIRDRHINRDAPKDDIEASMIAIDIGQDYQQWIEDYNTVVPITTAQILELTEGRSVEEVEENAKQAQEELDKQKAQPKVKQRRLGAVTTTPKKTLDLMAMAKGGRK